MSPLFKIILIIIFAGLLGGVTNYFLIWNYEIRGRESTMMFLKCLFMGVCASFTVPLFLQVLPNTLLDITNDMPPKNYLILAGLCVLAAYFSKRFLEDLYDKINSIEKKADEAKKVAEEVEFQTQELDDIDDIVNDVVTRSNTTIDAKEIEMVTDAVLNSTYSYRTIPGIAEDTIKDINKVSEILDLLKKTGYIEMKKNRKGNEIWKSLYHNKQNL
jgi:hypothetical protein